MAVNIYLTFDGNCMEALEFYSKVFDSKPQIMTFGDMPDDPELPISEEENKLVMHGRINVNGSDIMFSDNLGYPFTQGNNFSIALISKSQEDIQKWFTRLKEGGEVRLDLQETSWSKCYGSLTDKFGIDWQLSLE